MQANYNFYCPDSGALSKESHLWLLVSCPSSLLVLLQKAYRGPLGDPEPEWYAGKALRGAYLVGRKKLARVKALALLTPVELLRYPGPLLLRTLKLGFTVCNKRSHDYSIV